MKSNYLFELKREAKNMKDERTKAKEIEQMYNDLEAKERAKNLMMLKDGYKPKDSHYNNDNGSLYLFAQQHELNAYEFEIIKRIVRCRKKGEFISDLEKTKRVIDIYFEEQNYLYKNQIEKLNK